MNMQNSPQIDLSKKVFKVRFYIRIEFCEVEITYKFIFTFMFVIKNGEKEKKNLFFYKEIEFINSTENISPLFIKRNRSVF